MSALPGIIDTLKQLLLVRLELAETGLSADQITEDSLLVDGSGLGLDSVEVLDLLVGVEKSFGLKIKNIDMDFLKTYCHSVRSLADYIAAAKIAVQPEMPL